MAATALTFDTAFSPRHDAPEPVVPGVLRLTAANVGPYTFTGTNSYLIGEAAPFVLDPGPDDPAHLAAILQALAGRRPAAILLTHTHRDHSGLARRLAAATGSPIWSNGPHRLSRPPHRFEFNPVGRESDFTLVPDRLLTDGEAIATDGIRLEIIQTPGHCANHLAFALTSADILFSGDHVMGWNSTLIAVPDGSMADYFHSLDKLIARPETTFLPGHGGPIADGPAHAAALRAHRELRNSQIVAAVAAGSTAIAAVVARLYPTQPAKIRRAAAMTVAAHVEYLAARGQLTARRTLLGLRLSPLAQ